LISKKQEFENMSAVELKDACTAKELAVGGSKDALIGRLMEHADQNDEIDKMVTKMKQAERKTELLALDKEQLVKMCDKAGLDPYVKEILVERISKQENQMGRYSRAVAKQDEEPQTRKLDMVEALLANESTRKKEKEVKGKQEEEAAEKKKKFRAMSVEDLKKAVEKKGLEASKKEDMIEALFEASVEEEKVLARKSELKKMGVPALKELILSNGLESGSASSMVETILAHEAARRKELQAFEAKISEVVAQKKEQLDKKSLSVLKDMCLAKGLPVGGGKEEKVERLIEQAQRDGEIDKVISTMMRNAKKDTLASLEKPDLLKLCENMGVNPFMKDIMVERILGYEEECEEPVTKKPRKSY